MSVFTETTSPYEFLVRWNNGIIAGAHVGFLETVLKDGKIISQKQKNVESVAIGLQEGFPLTEILDQTLIDALLLIEATQAENNNLKSQDTQLNNALAVIELLQAEIIVLKTPIVESNTH